MAESTHKEALSEEIARRAYSRFCDRGCAPGGDVDDWMAAEREVLAEQEAAETPTISADGRPHRRNEKRQR